MFTKATDNINNKIKYKNYSKNVFVDARTIIIKKRERETL